MDIYETKAIWFEEDELQPVPPNVQYVLNLQETIADLLAALRNIRDTVESCYVAGGWVPLDAEEMKTITGQANAALAKAKGE